MAIPFAAALAVVLDRVSSVDSPWMLAGSTSAILQGVDVPPNDLDFPHATAEGVYAFAEALRGFATPPGVPTPAGTKPVGDWLSSGAEPVVHFPNRGGQWTYGRWYVECVEVEAAHIAQPGEEELLSEIHGRPIWTFMRTVSWNGRHVPVTPLEVNFVTNLARGRQARAEAVAVVLRQRGHDAGLLERALKEKGFEPQEVYRRYDL